MTENETQIIKPTKRNILAAPVMGIVNKMSSANGMAERA
ncbi:MAG: hypothetical protein ACI9DO_002547 [Reinekea sp.]|jgi:hypothetical protein